MGIICQRTVSRLLIGASGGGWGGCGGGTVAALDRQILTLILL